MDRNQQNAVPTVLHDPGFRSLSRSIRPAVFIAAAIVVVIGLWAWLFNRPSAAPIPPVTAAAQPAADPNSSEGVPVPPTPFPATARTSVVAQVVAEHAPLLAASPAAVAAASSDTGASASVPRVLTPAESASSRMVLEAPSQPAAAARPVEQSAAAASGPVSTTDSAAHSSFFAQQDGEIGYAREDAACIVRATSTIQARLVSHVDSELPGGIVTAQIIQPVYCSNGSPAIPAGAILQGAYDSGTTSGESRLLVVFTRIIFAPTDEHPNGRAYTIGAQSATDALGGTGLSGRVNTHAGRVFGQALVYTLLGATGEAIGRSSSSGTVILGGGGSVTGQFAPQAQAVKPTIYADAGDSVAVVLSRDLPMEPLR